MGSRRGLHMVVGLAVVVSVTGGCNRGAPRVEGPPCPEKAGAPREPRTARTTPVPETEALWQVGIYPLRTLREVEDVKDPQLLADPSPSPTRISAIAPDRTRRSS